MADKIVKIYGDARFLPRHDTLENWQRKNPILLEAEPSYVIDGEDGKKIKFGDGVTPWNDLPYLSSNINNGGDITVDQTYSPISENAQSGKAVAEAVSDKQDSLVSGTNIKTINNQSILGSGNITIEGGSDVEVDQNYNPESENAQSGKAVAEAVAKSGGGTTDYELLDNKPQINGIELNGNLTAEELSLVDKATFDNNIGNIETALDNIIAIQNELIGGDAV